ncbi:thioesterase family protein [Kocuria sp. HSID16901]|uniref:thioesterase family protein n=1 Tax=Kocuria sp. HSID16901 TaxID=2419505 RepID=UPI000F8826C9|nr:thioesterase family protein [Kocuria sp. HSID16901]RUQ21695.1 thioesterase family protein [Kocuria sp. HSID16901]
MEQTHHQLSEILGQAEAYYVKEGDGRFRSTIHAQGAWNEHEQHMAPASGLLAHCLEQHEPREDMRIARISYEILGLIPAGEFEVVTTTLRPGRTIELIQAEMIAGGRTAIRASAWRLICTDTSEVAATEEASIPSRDQCTPWRGADEWPGGFIRSLDGLRAPEHRAGHGIGWVRPIFPLVDGEESPDWVHLMGAVDASNGIATRVAPGDKKWIFPNVDLQVHLFRRPEGQWLGLENEVSFGDDGIGLTSSILHDDHGAFGRAEQTLTLRRIGS